MGASPPFSLSFRKKLSEAFKFVAGVWRDKRAILDPSRRARGRRRPASPPPRPAPASATPATPPRARGGARRPGDEATGWAGSRAAPGWSPGWAAGQGPRRTETPCYEGQSRARRTADCWPSLACRHVRITALICAGRYVVTCSSADWTGGLAHPVAWRVLMGSTCTSTRLLCGFVPAVGALLYQMYNTH